MINNVVLVGRLTKDPELRYTPSGIANVRFTIAVNRTFTGQNGEKDADFINCVAWRKQAENLANYQRKGNLIGVEGRIQTGSFEGQDGKKVYTTDVVADAIQFLETRKSNEQQQQQPPQTQQQSNQQNGQSQQQYQNSNQNQQSYNNAPQGQQQYGGNGQQQYNNTNFQTGNSQNNQQSGYSSQSNYNGGGVEVSDDDLPF